MKKKQKNKAWLDFCCCYYRYDHCAIKFFKLREDIRMHWVNLLNVHFAKHSVRCMEKTDNRVN